MRKAMEHMAANRITGWDIVNHAAENPGKRTPERKLTYWGFVYNFRQWKWGKAGHLLGGLLITSAFILAGITAPGWWKLFGWAALGLIHWGHWRNYNGRQA